MQPMSSKELEYIIDSMSNEDLLMRQTAAAAAIATHPQLKSCCDAMVQTHQANYNTLMKSLEQHQSVAPMGMN